MNVFVLSTGRCGSVTFAKACEHLTNYTSAHESRCGHLGEARVEFPDQHIEADNRLSWFLGRLEKTYGDDAFYVHLVRNREETAKSFNRRWNLNIGIISAYAQGILMQGDVQESDKEAICLDYWDTINENIEAFLKGKKNKMVFELANASSDFPEFLRRIEAEGDLDLALSEWGKSHNASKDTQAKKIRSNQVSMIERIYKFFRG